MKLYAIILHEDHCNNGENTQFSLRTDYSDAIQWFTDTIKNRLTNNSDREHIDAIDTLCSMETYEIKSEPISISTDLFTLEFTRDSFCYNDNHDCDRFSIEMREITEEQLNSDTWIQARI